MRTFALNLILALSCLFFNMNIGQAQQKDKTLSPYFKIISDNDLTEQLPLKSTTAEVNILGVIADVKIEQTYENTGATPIEAVYVFPASTQAAVYHMEMIVGGRTIKAQVQEKGQARATYVKAKAEGKRTSLLEQDRPNVFTMNVANILPGDRISVVLKYTENIIPESGVYAFVYPTVVGPRYTGESTSGSTKLKTPFTNEGISPMYEFDIDVNIKAGMSIQNVFCNSHQTDITFKGLEEAVISLNQADKNGGDRDFVLEYQLAGKKIDSGLLVYEGEEENHFMLTVQPPSRVKDSDITQREYIFVLDVSGSMHGFPLNVTKKLMRNLLGNLRSDDKFNLLLFAGNANVYAEESVYGSAQEVENALNILNQRQGGGGTRLLNALNRAVNIPKCDEGLSRSIIVVSDGYINVEREVFDLIKNNNEFNFYSFGIGRSVNRHLIEGIAHVGGGEPLVILDESEANEKAEKFRNFISSPVLTDIFIDWGNFDVYDLEPNAFNDLLAERPIVITGKYRGEANGLIQLTGINGEEKFKAVYNSSYAESSSSNKSLAYLWARNRIKILDDYIKLDSDQSEVKEVTKLGLKYNLLTNYTSFVAVDEEPVLASNTKTHKVNQALPLPKDVSRFAIGSTPTYVNTGAYGAELSITNHLTELDLSQMKKSLNLKTYETTSEEILRNRPSITFILGEDEKENSSYFSNAKKYFLTKEKTTFFVDTCTSLLSVRQTLKEMLPEGDQAWGKVNLVLHSNQWTGMSLSTTGIEERTTVDVLLEASANGKLQALNDKIIDKHSLIDIHACGLGDNEKLLAALQRALGGNDENVPGVRSTSNFVYYAESAGQVNSKSLKPYYAFYKTAFRPAELHLKKQFEKRYPEVEIDWMNAMRLKEPRWDGDPFHTRFNVPVEWDLVFEKDDAAIDLLNKRDDLAFVKSQSALMDILEKFEIPVEKFRWIITKKNVNGKVEVRVRGKSTVLCVLVEE